jgi:hypothetical protein
MRGQTQNEEEGDCTLGGSVGESVVLERSTNEDRSSKRHGC